LNRIRLILLKIATVGFLAGFPSVHGASSSAPSFETDIRPILKANCFQCHGEEKKLQGGLDLRLKKLIEKGAKSGAVLSLGDHKSSRLFEVVASGEMPPKDELHLKPEEIELIAKWINAGAPIDQPEPNGEPEPGEFIITTVERNHWAFQPIRRPAVPTLQGTDYNADNPIDAFIDRSMERQGLVPSPEARPITLLRRAHFDLTGLPPTPAEAGAFLAAHARQPEAAWSDLIDRLLASPHYGERWGRHWLDVAGYADSEGYDDKDVTRPDAWSYRDYVVRSLNQDKPWNDFIREQIAGDELVHATHANAQGLANKSEDALEKLTATGFLRMGPDGSGSKPTDPTLARNKVITETVNIVSSSLLGMTVGCAECHHHRYEPIPQQDFYRLRAIFEPVYDVGNWRAPNARRAAILSEADTQLSAKFEKEAKVYDKKYYDEMMRIVGVIFERELLKIPEAERAFARQTYETEAKKRTPEQAKFLAEKYPAVNVQRGTLNLFIEKYKDVADLKKGYMDFQKQYVAIRAKKPKPAYIRVATEDTKKVPVTKLFHRGDHNSPEPKPIAPGGLSVVADLCGDESFPTNNAKLPTTGRRLAFAEHLTNGRHPLTARVLVNRFWMQHFGRGLVGTPENFGVAGERPSHPELLDWLASDFMDGDWRLKRLHKLIMTSRTYRQSSARSSDAEQIDQDNRLLWRMPVRRLEAESVRDAILTVSGSLNPNLAGEPVAVAANAGGIIAVGGGKVSPNGAEFKRSLYVQVRRTQPVAMLQSFDAPQMEPNCARRVSSTVATQSLAMLNSDFVIRQSTAFADHVWDDVNHWRVPDNESLIAQAWKAAYSSAIPNEQAATLLAFFNEQEAHFNTALKSKDAAAAKKKTLATLCQVLLASNEFLYVD
jgi:hypothetical protein